MTLGLVTRFVMLSFWIRILVLRAKPLGPSAGLVGHVADRGQRLPRA